MNPFCSCQIRENVIATASLSKWPDPELPWTIVDLVPGVDLEPMIRGTEWGFRQWAGVCRLHPYYTESAAKARLLIGTQRIDGPGGVLAQCELPFPGLKTVRMWLDTGDDWAMELPTELIDLAIVSSVKMGLPVPQTMNAVRAIILALVVSHESGHAIGIGHAPKNSPNRMAPSYDPRQLVLGQWDVAESVLRYGQPVTPPLPPPPPPTPGVPTMSGILRFMLDMALRAFERYAASTPDKTDDLIAAFLRQILAALARGDTAKVEAALTAATEKLTAP